MRNILLLLLALVLGLGALALYKKSNTAGNEGGDSSILALSYNVCFNAMTNNGSTGSAAQLGEKCVWDAGEPERITTCAENIADMIDALPNEYNSASIDFVGLQEASRWQALQAAALTTLSEMTAIPTHQGREYAVTFYDPNKYNLEYTWSDDLGSGRPFQISIFEEKVVFVNVHNGHHTGLDYISDRLSDKLTNNLTESQIKTLTDYRIIVVGDFNQIALGENYVSFTPFENAGISTEVSLSNPPSTCCDTNGDLPWSGRMNGDFIFDSESTAHPEVPVNYDRNQLQSDHLPVVAKL